MNGSGLKARDIEALALLYSAPSRSAPPVPARLPKMLRQAWRMLQRARRSTATTAA